MKERIKELAVQAGITTNIDTDYFEKDMNKWVDYYTEKFAELIVKEMLDIFDKRAEPGTGFYEPHEPAEMIREHFGVLE